MLLIAVVAFEQWMLGTAYAESSHPHAKPIPLPHTCQYLDR
uniref:Transmembrane protein n=1 Tax=Medicago truncatula TaxID=3880 RepID=I3SFI4_MEDTR|nr:unknown [Medicago truncatula]